jgi:hypothetical protein
VISKVLDRTPRMLLYLFHVPCLREQGQSLFIYHDSDSLQMSRGLYLGEKPGVSSYWKQQKQ